jgi:putative membrane protein
MLGLIPLALTLLTVGGYGAALARLRRRGDRWPARRAICLLTGSLCVAAAVLPPVSTHDGLFAVHIGQHLLLGMTGPAFLALSAPVTLALRALPRAPRRTILRVLHSRPVTLVSAPATAVVLNLGGLYALYLTGLYSVAEHNDLLHAAVHLHMFLAGCLLSWAIIGIDPIRRRPGLRVRLAALAIAAAGHDTLAKLMYAHDLPADGGSIAARHTGAELMYYGGTVIDLAFAIILMSQWYQATGRELARAAQRSASQPRAQSPAPGQHGDRNADRLPVPFTGQQSAESSVPASRRPAT